MQQGAVLAMLAKEPAHGYQLRARLRQALGPVGEGMNDGQIYVTLTRLGKAGLVTAEQEPGGPDRSDRKVYALTSAGQRRVADWLAEVSWPKPDLAEFHLKLIAAAAAGLADPITIIDTQRGDLLRRLRETQRAALAEPDRSPAARLACSCKTSSRCLSRAPAGRAAGGGQRGRAGRGPDGRAHAAGWAAQGGG
jgi:DNA-binding PadR family transcriptional regulator